MGALSSPSGLSPKAGAAGKAFLRKWRLRPADIGRCWSGGVRPREELVVETLRQKRAWPRLVAAAGVRVAQGTGAGLGSASLGGSFLGEAFYKSTPTELVVGSLRVGALGR